ncbi:MAG: PqqD family protein [Armatimonadota bacterium]
MIVAEWTTHRQRSGMMGISAATTPRLASHAVTHTIEGTAALLNVNSGIYYTIDGAGIILVEMCDGEATLTEIAQAVCAEYDVEEERALEDLIELTEALLDEGLIVTDEA